MSLNDDRINFLRSTPKQQEKLRKIDPDSAAYALIGRKCVFCRDVITRKDVTRPNECYESQLGNPAHKQCLFYCMTKYPTIPLSQLEGKIQRVRSDQFGL